VFFDGGFGAHQLKIGDTRPHGIVLIARKVTVRNVEYSENIPDLSKERVMPTFDNLIFVHAAGVKIARLLEVEVPDNFISCLFSEMEVVRVDDSANEMLKSESSSGH